jgi:uncharacterized membrane protein
VHIKNTYLQICVIVISIALVFIIQFIPDNVARIIVGLPFVLLFPGFTLISVLFPRKESLGGIERLALSFGLSLAVVPLIGLILNYTSWGITLYSVLYSLFGFVVVFAIIAIIRQRNIPENERPEVRIEFSFKNWGHQNGKDKLLSVFLVLAILAAVGAMIYTLSVPKTGEAFTEFYLLNEEGRADDYPSQIYSGNEATVIVGIVNHEQQPASYRVEVQLDEDPADDIAPVTLKTIDNINLQNEEKYDTPVSIKMTIVGSGQKILFLLYKDNGSEVYLQLHLVIDVILPK